MSTEREREREGGRRDVVTLGEECSVSVCLFSLCSFYGYSFIRKTKLVNRKTKGRNEEWLVACLLMEECVRTT